LIIFEVYVPVLRTKWGLYADADDGAWSCKPYDGRT